MDADEVLRDAVIGGQQQPLIVVCDCGNECQGHVEGDEGQLLVWSCPKCGPQRDVNA